MKYNDQVKKFKRDLKKVFVKHGGTCSCNSCIVFRYLTGENK